MKLDHDEFINLCKSQSSATISDLENFNYTVLRRNGKVSCRTQGLVGEGAARYECFYGGHIRSPNRTGYAP
jgi:hypothetical protein